MKRFLYFGLTVLVIGALGAGVWWWRDTRGFLLEPRYQGKPISAWFPHWWHGVPPVPPKFYDGPDEAGPEAIPFLVHELNLADLPEHRFHGWLTARLPTHWRSRLPQPYPPRYHRPAVLYWLKHILHKPGGSAAIAAAADQPGPFSRRRLLSILGEAETDLTAVVATLVRAMEDSDPGTRRAAGRSLLQLKPEAVESALPALLRLISTDRGAEGITAWTPSLKHLAAYPAHAAEIRAALAPWVASKIPEAIAVLAELDPAGVSPNAEP